MNTKNMKRAVLWVTLGLSVFIILLAVAKEKFNLDCSYTTRASEIWKMSDGSDYITSSDSIELCELFVVSSLAPLILAFLLSLLTYWAKDEVFRAWWNFAKWWVPVIIGVTLWVENAGGGGGWGMNGGAFDVFFISIFYFIFILVSFVRITQAYLRTREKK